MTVLHQYVLFHLAQLFIRGNSGYLFPKRWNWQLCHTHQAFKHPLWTFSGKLRTFPMVKSKTIGFLLDQTQQYTTVLFAKTPRELLPEKELLSAIMRLIQRWLAHATLHDAHDFTMRALKVAERAWQNDFHCYRCAPHITL